MSLRDPAGVVAISTNMQTGDCHGGKSPPRNDVYESDFNPHHSRLDFDRLHFTSNPNNHTDSCGSFSDAVCHVHAHRTQRCDDPVHRRERVRASLRVYPRPIKVDPPHVRAMERHGSRHESGWKTDRVRIQSRWILESIHAGYSKRKNCAAHERP